MTRFICRRHLNENFGLHLIFVLWFSLLRRLKAENEFVKIQNEIRTEIDFYFAEKGELAQEVE